MRARTYILLGCVSVAASGIRVAASPPVLQELISEALARHPALRAARQHALATAHQQRPAGALADPMIRLDLSNVPTSDWDFSSSPMSGRQLGISQKLPWPGVRAARERSAHAATLAAEARAGDAEARIVHTVKQAFYSLSFLDRAIDITSANEQLLADFVRIARTKYSVGRGLQQDVLTAQVSQSSLRDQLMQLQASRRQAEAALNAALDRPLGATIVPTGELTQTTLPYTVDSLEAMAAHSRPELVALAHEAQGWRDAARAAHLQGRPDFEVSVAYRQRSFSADPVQGSDFVSAGVAMRLPVWADRREGERAAEARMRAVAMESARAARSLQVRLEIRQRYVEIEAHRERARWLRTAIIPQAQQALSASLAGYQVDKVDFLSLLDSQVRLLEFEIDAYRHLTDAEQLLADIEMSVGTRFVRQEAE